ncbi:hypothetical protein Neosp_010024 [[Neocosmospora] mangrovei]
MARIYEAQAELRDNSKLRETHTRIIRMFLEHDADPKIECVVGFTDAKPTVGRARGIKYPVYKDVESILKEVFDLDERENPFAQGAFRWVAKGVYASGTRKSQACVVKWFKWGVVFEADYFTLDIKAVDKALEIVNRFNELNLIDKDIKINVPGIWQFEDGDEEWAGSKVLCEPFIQNYQKFNSNSGWNDDSRAWGEVMQALSHFSYHVSGGQFVLCDLQGGIYQREIVLSDPVILSRNRDYGVTDLGPEGISSFFSQHRCNNYCRPHWTQPSNPHQYFEPVLGTTMIRHSVPTAYSRFAGTR